MAIPYDHLIKPTTPNAPGLANQILFTPKSWVTAFGTFSVGTNPGDSMKITAAHTFEAGKGWLQLYTTPKTLEAIATQVGETDSQGANIECMGFHPGMEASMAEFMANEDEFYVMVKDIFCPTPRYIHMGTECLAAWKEGWVWKSGKAGGEGKKGFDVKFMSYQSGMYFYEATPTLYVAP